MYRSTVQSFIFRNSIPGWLSVKHVCLTFRWGQFGSASNPILLSSWKWLSMGKLTCGFTLRLTICPHCFKFEIDQSYLPGLITGLKTIFRSYQSEAQLLIKFCLNSHASIPGRLLHLQAPAWVLDQIQSGLFLRLTFILRSWRGKSVLDLLPGG